ncbi:MAG: sulfatase-like hydrolase/transferase [Anaerolineae bacterium]|nr:sulfatase-like hydrolase/transferase [Anaerolineae bacterium]
MSRDFPNILWIQCDELRADALSCYPENPWITPQTPNIQRIAESGVVFEQAFCPSPVCMPSRGSEMTSQYVPTLGVYHNVTSRNRGQYHFDTSWRTWTRVLRDAGYRAVNVGKLHIIDYDAWDESLSPPQFPNPRALIATQAEELGLVVLPGIQLIVGGTYPLTDGAWESFGPHRVTTLALEKLTELQRRAQPWLLRVSFVAPHTPVLAPPPFDQLYDPGAFLDTGDGERVAGLPAYERHVAELQESHVLTPAQVARARATYYGLMSAVDREIGRLLDRVPEDTIVLFTADHGTMLGELGRWQKQIFHYYVHRVPFILRAPGLASGRRQAPMDLLDTGPTLLARCGVPIPDGFRGQDVLADGFEGKDIFGAFGFGTRGAYLYEALERGPDCPRRICIRSGSYRLDLNIRVGGRRTDPEAWDAFFCDRQVDPDERRNAWGDTETTETTAALVARLLAWYDAMAVAGI